MKEILKIVLLLVICFSIAGCVRVTTARRADVVEQTPEGGSARASEVEVETYGWHALGLAIDIIVFPFKCVWWVVDLVI